MMHKIISIIFLCLVGVAQYSNSAKHDSPMPGAPVEQDTNDSEMKEVANQVVDEYNKQSTAANQYVLVKIISAKSQVVSGVLYNFELEVAESDCKKGEVCSNAKPTGNSKKISGSVLSQPWIKESPSTVSVKEI